MEKRWDMNDSRYSPAIASSGISYRWWSGLKRALKLGCNVTEEAKEGTPDYNPAHKFDLIYQCLIHNTNKITLKAGMDIVMDKSSWTFYGFGGLFVDYLKDKIVSRGGQTVLIMDCDRLRPRGYGCTIAKAMKRLIPSQQRDSRKSTICSPNNPSKYW